MKLFRNSLFLVALFGVAALISVPAHAQQAAQLCAPHAGQAPDCGSVTNGKVDVNASVFTSAVSVSDSSGNVANATASATLAAVAGKTTYIKGFRCTPGGATAAALVTVTVTNISNAGVTKTLSFTVGAPAGATLAGTPLVVDFENGIPAYQANTSIVVSMPALGSGNANASCSAWGYQF